MNPTDSDLRFDRATYAKGAGTGAPTVTPCASCKGPLGDSYWRWQQVIVCGRCRDGIAARLADSQSNERLAKAILTGGATALACGIAYATLELALHVRMAIATIGIGYVVARVVRNASSGIGGTRYQVVAAALTYVAATMGYIPEIWSGPSEAANPLKILARMLAAPLLNATESPIGLLIVGFGMWEAWKLTQGVPPLLEGPFRAGAATGPAA
jgi:hypothetical protein